MMQLGSRYSMQQVFDKSAYDELTKTSDKQSISGDVSLGIGRYSGSAEYSSETTTDETQDVAETENKEDRTITSLGAPPAEDELTWAQQSSIEAMPIDVIPMDLCSLFSTSGVDESSPNKDIMEEIKNAKLHQKCIKLLSIDGYCKKRVAPRSGFSVCNAIREGRQSHTCTEDAECGPRTHSGPNYECVSGKCVLAYTRIYDIHLAFQTPCSEGENVVCDVEPICEPGYKKIVKAPPTGDAWTPGGEGLGVANLNEFKDSLPDSAKNDAYTIHLCARKVSTTGGSGGPISGDKLKNGDGYGSSAYPGAREPLRLLRRLQASSPSRNSLLPAHRPKIGLISNQRQWPLVIMPQSAGHS